MFGIIIAFKFESLDLTSFSSPSVTITILRSVIFLFCILVYHFFRVILEEKT